MQKTLAKILFILAFLNVSVFSQKPILVSRFPKITMEELLAQTDSFLVGLVNNKNHYAVIKTFSGKKDLQGFPYRYAEVIKTQISFRGYKKTQVVVQNCGSNEDKSAFELHLYPQNIKLQNCGNPLIIPNQTSLFDSYFYHFETPGMDSSCCYVAESDSNAARASLKAFADLLKMSPDSKGYIISYNGTNVHWVNDKTIRILDSPNLGRKTAEKSKQFLINNEIEPSRIFIINGGYKDSTRNIELWFVPKGGDLPKPTPDYIPKKRTMKKPLKRRS